MKLKIKTCLFFPILIFLLHVTNANSFEKYLLPCNAGLLDESRRIALLQSGTHEKTNRNDGDVEKYQKTVGAPKGSAYCAAGQYYCFRIAAENLGLPESSIPIKQTALANAMFDDVKKKGNKSAYKVSRDDLIVWRRINTVYGHIERIVETGKCGWVTTIAFNTSQGINGNQYEGEGVFIKKRNIFHPLGRMIVRGLIGFNRI